MAVPEEGAEILVMSARDNVATALRDIGRGSKVSFHVESVARALTVLDDIPFGHKVAITDIAMDDCVVKYGEIIGRPTRVIQMGQHVHIHNVEGIRGRGDLYEKDVTAE